MYSHLTNSLQISGEVKGWVQENRGIVNQYIISQVSDLLGTQAAGGEKTLTGQEYRQRKVLLSKVKEYWIEGVLEKSLYTQAMIELGLEKRLDAVKQPLSDLEVSEESRQNLPMGTGAIDVFNQMGEGRTLLILGEPGAGKTITLLKLTQNLIGRTEVNLHRPIPVVLNLSSWKSKLQIADWLVQELWRIYQVSKKQGKSWIEDQQLLLLLDGLDEVKAEHREDCVEAINQFMQNHGQTEIVICSRIKDYEALSIRLRLRGAICIQSLTPEQINQYLARAGEKLEAVKTLLQQDTQLQELAKSPLTLSVMTLAYQGKKIEELPQTGSVEQRRQHLFNTYIEKRFNRKGTKQQYPKTQVIHWLSWLAQRMSQSSQTVFLIEQMQPTWLQTNNQKRFYRFGNFLIGGLVIILILWPIYAWDPLQQFGVWRNYISSNGKPAMEGGLMNALRWGLVLGLIFGWGRAEIKTFEALAWPWKKTWKDLLGGLISGLKWGLIFGLSLGIIGGSWVKLTWPYFKYVLLEQHIEGLREGILWGIVYGLKWGLSLGLSLGLINAMRGAQIETKTIPNQGIWRSARNATIIGLIIWLSLLPIYWFNSYLINNIYWGLIRGLDDWVTSHPIDLITPGLRWGLMLGLIFGGGVACIRHFTLRLILHRHNYIPWNYARFLHYATKLIFLQKVGGGYIFIHRMLLEHFANSRATLIVSPEPVEKVNSPRELHANNVNHVETQPLTSVQNKIFCSHCGHPNSAKSNFCNKCGTRLIKVN